MTTKVIVLIADRDDPKHGEITVLENERKAERLVETLLEAGFEQERIRIFTGLEMDMQVSHRPVVSLVTEGLRADEDSAEEEIPEPEPIEHPSEAEVEEEEPVTAYVRNGVRFSSLFRGA